MRRGDRGHIGGRVVVLSKDPNGRKVIRDDEGVDFETMDELLGDVPKGTRVTVLIGGTQEEQEDIIDRF